MIAVLFSLIFPQIILIKERRQFKQISMSTIVTVRRRYAVNQITGAILQITRPLDKSVKLKLDFLSLSTKMYVVGTQKNCLNVTVLLSAQNQ